MGMLYPNDYGAVSDIQNAYRTIHVIPSHRQYQGMRWDTGGGEVYLEDLRLCFGLRCAPYAFTQFSDFLVKCCVKQGAVRCVNYLDDFVMLGASEQECCEAQMVLHNVLNNFGFEVADKKVTSPSKEFQISGHTHQFSEHDDFYRPG